MLSPRLNSRWVRRGLLIFVGTAVGLVILSGPAWFWVIVPEWRYRQALMAVLVAAEGVYGAILGGILGGVMLCGVLVWRGRRRGRARLAAARGMLLLGSCLVGLAMAEGVVGAWRGWTRGRAAMPVLRERFEGGEAGALEVVVVGGSSAYGLPFEKWLSVGEIVAWKLGEVFPGRRVRLEVLAEPGVTLEQMHRKLAGFPRRPDVLIIYAGHNEFTYRYRWSRSVAWYEDERAAFDLARWGREWVGRVSPICATIREAVEANGRGERPPPEVTRALVDVPAVTGAEYRERLEDFRRRLEAIVGWCERVGTVPVLLIPPGNDAGFEPNRSVLPPGTPRAEREAFAASFLVIRRAEGEDAEAAIAGYRGLLAKYDGFAEAHYRLGRVLESVGRVEEAAGHYRAARDFDGLPMRCPTEFQEVYREVAARHGAAVLVDGEVVIAGGGPSGLLDDWSFLDAMHPNVGGHARLAWGVLEGLRGRGALGWPEGSAAPVVDVAGVVKRFGVDAEAWAAACAWGAKFYGLTAYIRHDPEERLERIARYERARREIGCGRSAEGLGLPGIGMGGVDP